MFTGMELMACHRLAVPAEVMQHVIHVESGNNPYAIGVVGGQLVRQPQNLPEALATVHMLDTKGYNYSLGVAQINRANLGKYGLDTYEQAFDPCPNVTAGSQILAACYASSGGNWGKAFSCYYSGNFVTGYRDGYVQKIYASINRRADAATTDPQAIPLLTLSDAALKGGGDALTKVLPHTAYRVALRSEIIDSAASLAVVEAGSAVAGKSTVAARPMPAPADHGLSPQLSPESAAPSASPPPKAASSSSVFVPTVRGPNDPVAQAPAVAQTAATASTISQPAASDRADLRQGGDDAAFVF